MDDFTEANVLEAICIADISNLRALGIALEIPKHITEEILLHQPISDRKQMLVAEFFSDGTRESQMGICQEGYGRGY